MFEARLAGTMGAPFRMTVEHGKIREFAAATHASSPEYLTDRAPVPPTFLMSYAFWATAENMAWGANPPSFRHLLHGGQEFTFIGPPPVAGDDLECQMRIDRVYTKSGRTGEMQFVETVIDFRHPESGELRAESRATLIIPSSVEVSG